MRSARGLTVLLVILAISVLLAIPATASDSAVAKGDVGVSAYDNRLTINAGSSDDFRIEVANYLPYTENDMANSRMISVAFDSGPDINLSIDSVDENFVLDGQRMRSIVVTVSVDKYASADTYKIDIILKVKSLYGDTAVMTEPVNMELTVKSPLSTGNTFNKVLGMFENPFPEPFNTPLASAIITILLWMVIGALIMVILVPFLFRIFIHGYEEEGDKIKKGLRSIIMLIVFLFAFDSGLRVYGAAEELIGPIEVWFNVFYIALGAVIAWKLYLIFIQSAISKISNNNRVDQREMDLEPVMRLFGKLVIWVLAVALIMSALGFDLTAIIASAGIISLGITLGAQNILNQFFSGMMLLLTRPFKSGDLVKIGSDKTTIYKVSSVNVMNTIFENWDNEETVIMPNSMVSSSAIVNLTGDGLMYKNTVFMNISYKDDVGLAKELMEKVAMEHPSVITNGSVDLPSTRVTSFLDSGIEIRLTSYVYDFNDNGKIGGQLREAIFRAFKENGISIPFPQRDINLNIVHEDDLKKNAE